MKRVIVVSAILSVVNTSLARALAECDCVIVDPKDEQLPPDDFAIHLIAPPDLEVNMVTASDSYFPPKKGKRGRIRRW